MDPIRYIKTFIQKIFDVSSQRENEDEIVASIKNNVEVQGPNLWVLMFAILVASLGLNVNSTAVIIGAMLISPIMGPIMGIGLGLGINDFELIKKAFRNLSIFTIVGILTSTLYFTVSPLSEATDEILSRTNPTIYDVMIAFFGGMAGIMASCTKLKTGTVIPGVAIATALMPPLCTAGFGLATGKFAYFLGAFYLYMINSVFIAFATTLGIKILNFHKKEFTDKARGKQVQQIVYTILILTMVPSVYITYKMICSNIFEQNATAFINNEINFPNTLIVHKKCHFMGDSSKIDISLVGKELPEETIAVLQEKLKIYNLNDAKLNIKQGYKEEEKNSNDINNINNLVLHDFYKKSQTKVQEQEETIKKLETQIRQNRRLDSLSINIAKEMSVIFPYVNSIAISKLIHMNLNTNMPDSSTIALISFKKNIDPKTEELKKLHDWIKIRTKVETIELLKTQTLR